MKTLKKIYRFFHLQAVLWHSDRWTDFNRLRQRYEPTPEMVADQNARIKESYETAKTLTTSNSDLVAKAEPAAVAVDEHGRSLSEVECPECRSLHERL